MLTMQERLLLSDGEIHPSPAQYAKQVSFDHWFKQEALQRKYQRELRERLAQRYPTALDIRSA